MINKFLEWQKSSGLKDSTIKNYRMYLNPMNDFKPLVEWSNDDAIKYILKLQKTSKPSTVEQSKIVMKVFFKWLQKPEAVANIKIKNIKNNLKRDDILTLNDIEKMIETTPSPLYKALIAFLFESGARINEALDVKVKDIQDTNLGMTINIPQTKTGEDYRQMLCSLSSAIYIRNHITYSDLQPDDILFNLSAGGVWRHLKKIGARANITKRVYPHAFRHAHATDMVLREYQESIIKMQMGWEPGSKMIGRYQHINNNDVINAMAKKAGTDITKAPIKNLTQPKTLEIANASLKIKKLEDENDSLKIRLDEMEEQRKKDMALNEDMIKAMIEQRVAELMKKSQ